MRWRTRPSSRATCRARASIGGASSTGTGGSVPDGDPGAAGAGGGGGGRRRGGAANRRSDAAAARLLRPVRSGAPVDYSFDISADEWAKMDYEFRNRDALKAAGLDYKTYHPIVFHYGAETVTDAQVRLKGQSSWRSDRARRRRQGEDAVRRLVRGGQQRRQVPRRQQDRLRHAPQRRDVPAGTTRLHDDGRAAGAAGAVREQRPRDDQRAVLRPLRQRGARRRRFPQARFPRGVRAAICSRAAGHRRPTS